MAKTSATRLFEIGTFVAYVALVAAGSFLVRPNGVSFPGFAFFLGFCLLPCLISWLLVLAAGRMSAAFRAALLLVAVLAFYLLCHLQLKGLVGYALGQSYPTVEGLISNFYVFSGRILDRSVFVASVFLLLFTIAWPKLKHRLGP